MILSRILYETFTSGFDVIFCFIHLIMVYLPLSFSTLFALHPSLARFSNAWHKRHTRAARTLLTVPML